MLARGDVLGGYEIEDLLGIGGMAIVYRARQRSLGGREVALKVLAPERLADQSFRERFRREGEHAARLDHPHIVTVHDAGEADGHLYIAMRLIEGQTLYTKILQEGPLSPHETVALLRPIAEALDAAHDRGLVHRDVKPQNILIDHAGRPYLADFGIAKSAVALTTLTSVGSFIGTIHYAAPEQAGGEEATAASDIYSLTAVLYHCLSGHVPFPYDTEVRVLSAHLMQPPPSFLESGPPELMAVDPMIERGMAKDPRARYVTATALIDAVAAALRDSDQVPAYSPETWRRPEDGVPENGAPTSDPTKTTGAPPKPNEATPVVKPTVDAPIEPFPRWEAAKRTSVGGMLDSAARSIAGLTQAPPAAEPVPATEPDYPEPDRRRTGWSTRPRRRRLWLLLLPLAGVAVVAFVLATGGSGPHVSTASAGTLSVNYSAPWQPVPVPALPVDGVRLTSERDLVGPGGVAARAGVLDKHAVAAGGLPPDLARAASGTVSTAAVTAGDAHGRRYSGTLNRNGQHFAAYVFPTSGADVALICDGPPGPGFASCEKLAGAVDINATALAPEPDPAVAKPLSAALVPLAAARQANAPGLAAGSVAARTQAANRLRAANLKAAKAISRIHPGRRRAPTMQALTAALSGEATALGRLATAASKHDRAGYARARTDVATADSNVRRATAALAAVGYRKPGALGKLSVASSLPAVHHSSQPAAQQPSSSGSQTPTNSTPRSYVPPTPNTSPAPQNPPTNPNNPTVTVPGGSYTGPGQLTP